MLSSGVNYKVIVADILPMTTTLFNVGKNKSHEDFDSRKVNERDELTPDTYCDDLAPFELFPSRLRFIPRIDLAFLSKFS